MSPPEPRFEVILNLRARPGSVARLAAWLTDNLPDTRGFEGCVSVQALQAPEDTNHLVVIGQWQSRDHWERYIRWREDRGDLAIVAALVDGEPSFTCFEVLGNWADST